MNARADLDLIEKTTDWQALVDMALADPPRPDDLLFAANRWSTVFSVVYGGAPLEPDYPDLLRNFFRRLAAADFPPELLAWIDDFEAKHGRKPAESDLPRRLRPLIPSNKPNGRPRADTRRWQAARRAWTAAVLKGSYETRRDVIANMGEALSNAFGYSQASIQGDRPSSLAIEKLTEETGLSKSRLADLMGHRKRK